MLPHYRTHLKCALITFSAVVTATLLRAIVNIFLHELIPYSTFYPAIMISVLYGGFVWGLVGTALSALAASFWLTPFGLPLISEPSDLAAFGLFLLVACSIVLLAEGARRAHKQAEQAAEERQLLLTRERAARQEAERANRAKDQFLAAVTHELRTPLQSILGWVQLLRDCELDEAETTIAMTSIERSVVVQAQLINDLLDLNRIIMGKLRLDPRPVWLAEIVQAAVETVRPAAQAKNIRIELTVGAASGSVLGDADRLQQVAWNLLSNAIKFTPSGGVIHAEVTERGDYVEMKIRDTGEGIEPAFLPKIFERFEQGEGDGRREGLGLGLAIVKELVELHGGSVAARSDGKGKGAEFQVILPRRRIPAIAEDGRQGAEGALEAQPQVSLSGARVLVVEDDPEARQLVAKVLESYGAIVMTAASAANAAELLKMHRPDVITCDLEMPEVSGFDFVKRMRREPRREGNLPVVALSAHTSEADRRQSLQAGFQAHLSKPVAARQLVTTLRDVITTH